MMDDTEKGAGSSVWELTFDRGLQNTQRFTSISVRVL